MTISKLSDEYYLSKYESFIKFYDRVPHIEREIYKYCIDFKMGQSDIAALTGLTQGAISHRISRMFSRLDFLEEVEKLSPKNPEAMFQDLKKYCDPVEIELLKSVYETTSQSHSAFRLNYIFNLTGEKAINQVKLKYSFSKILRRLFDTEYFNLFNYIGKNWYILSEVRLPQFDRTNDD